MAWIRAALLDRFRTATTPSSTRRHPAGRARAPAARPQADRASGAYSVDDWLRYYARHSHDHADQIHRARRGEA